MTARSGSQRRLQDGGPVGAEDSRKLAHRRAIVRDMFEHVAAQDHVEGRVWEVEAVTSICLIASGDSRSTLR